MRVPRTMFSLAGKGGGKERRKSFSKKIVDLKIETAIYTAPQAKGPLKTVFAKSDSSKEICKKLLTKAKT